MKTKRLAAALVSLVILFAFTGPLTARAEENTLILPEKISAELSSEGVLLPVVKVDGKYSYRIGVYDITDAAYENPLAEGVSKFVFEAPGRYALKYTVEKRGEANVYLYTELTVTDEIPPVIVLGDTRKNYSVGNNVLLDYTATDNSGFAPEVSVRIYRNGNEYADLNGSRSFKAEQDGDYEIVIRAADRGGLTTELKRSFSVGGESKKTQSVVPYIVIPIVVAIAAISAIAAFIIIRRKKSK